MRLLILLLIAGLSLSACATVVSETCPTLFDYPQQVMDQAADELEQLPNDSVLPDLIGDYGVVREEIRACRGDK